MRVTRRDRVKGLLRTLLAKQRELVTIEYTLPDDIPSKMVAKGERDQLFDAVLVEIEDVYNPRRRA